MFVEVVLGLVILYLLWLSFRKPSGLPPGHWGLPLIGYIPLTTMTFDQQIENLQKKHGDIYLWRVGTQVIVFLHDYHLIRSAFSGTDFLDRPEWDVFSLMERPVLGIIASRESIWKNNRRFSLRQLRDLGMGKSKLVAAVQTQAQGLVEELKKQAGEANSLPHALNVSIVNVIWQMVGGKQFSMTDPQLKEFEDIIDELVTAFARLAIQDFFPWSRYILPKFLANRLFQRDILYKIKERFLQFFQEVIEEHRATLNRNSPRDLIDGYLMEMDDKKDDPATTCSEKDLGFLMLNLFFAGSETTVNTLTWMFYYLASYPEVQRKLQAEIDEVLPKGTLATLDDRLRLPYTEAVLHEVLRKSSLASTGVFHVATRDTHLGGYTIPKGTLVCPAIAAMHHDPRYWHRPDEFLPERWLDEHGNFITKKEGFLAFGIGESLARMELLIFSTTVFQSLSFSHPPGKKTDLRPIPYNPFGHNPRTQDVFITIRS